MVTTHRPRRSGVQIRMSGSVLESRGGSILASAEALNVWKGFSNADYNVKVPLGVNVVDQTDPSLIILERTGNNGYEFSIQKLPNESALPLEAWIVTLWLQ